MIYVVAWIVLGSLLSFIAYALLEMSFIKYLLADGIVPVNHMTWGQGYCTLPVWLQALLLVGGIMGGYLAGIFFWRVIYVEGRYRKKGDRWGKGEC